MIRPTCKKAEMASQLIPERYDITAGQIREIRELCGSDVHDLVTKAFCFGFYRAMDCINRERQKSEASF